MTIPASAIVSVTPQVLAAAGQGLDLNGVILTKNTQVPANALQPFSNAEDVAAYFGPSSQESILSQKYFAGFDNSNIKPGRLYFSLYNEAEVGAYLRSGPITQYTIPELAALGGSLSIMLDGYTHSAPNISLAGVTSYSNAANLISAALFATSPPQATCSAGTISGTTMTVGGTLTGSFSPGQTVTGTGVTADTIIEQQLTGTPGGAGTYLLSVGSTVGTPELLTAQATNGAVTFDSVSGSLLVTSGISGGASTAAYATGALAGPLFMTQAEGAILSQGAEAATPNAFMENLITLSQNWASFMTAFDPDEGLGNANKMAFAEWNATQNNRWVYVCWDNDASPKTVVPATACMGQLLVDRAISGTMMIYDSQKDAALAAFACGSIASIDYTELNGRITLAFKHQSGLPGEIMDQTTGDNLIANGYNFYGEYATANDQFIWFYPGSISGAFKWADSYVNQIWLNNEFQVALMVLLDQVKAIPYNIAGRQLIEASVGDVIRAGLNFGAYSPGVNLSSLQEAEVKNSAGVDIISTLNVLGYYFQVLQATPEVRAARGSPPCNFWYCDAGAVQKIHLASIELQ